jgi:hypothetical protein
MARAYGSNAHLLMKRETAYGEAATSNYIRVPFKRCNLGSEQGLIDDPVLGQGRRGSLRRSQHQPGTGHCGFQTISQRCPSGSWK